jgi:hypothetical protein
MSTELVAPFVEGFLAFDLQLCTRGGLNHELYGRLQELLGLLAEELRGADSIPKPLAAVFVDMTSALMSNAALYEGAVADEITHAAVHLQDLARDVCTD